MILLQVTSRFSLVSLQIFFDDNEVSEGAIDTGGPTRELLQLVMSQLLKHPMFEGPVDCKQLVRNAQGMI